MENYPEKSLLFIFHSVNKKYFFEQWFVLLFKILV